MIITYKGYDITGTPAEIHEFLFVAERVDAPATMQATGLPEAEPEKVAEAVVKQTAKRKQKDFDTGKARALREAGWTFAKIADEMGVAPQTVANRLKHED